MDCSTSLHKKIYPDSAVAKKVTCGSDKTKAIISGLFKFCMDFISYIQIFLCVLGPFSVAKLIEEMKNQPFSISSDCSNHGASKMSPTVVRFFQIQRDSKSIAGF